MSFKILYDFESRLYESKKIKYKYPDRIPIICEKIYNARNTPNLDKKKYLVPDDYTIGQFLFIIRRRNELHNKSTQSIYLFIDGGIPSTSNYLRTIYNQHKDSDGFLYIEYSSENTFGYK